jgi:low temperature requirement protein LtrA
MGSLRAVVKFRTADETHRVTTLELLFDLVFVFAFTQVSGLMAETHSATGVLQAMVILGVLWWSWVSYGWLANQAHADAGIVRIAMIVAMAAIFILSLMIPESYAAAHGEVFAPVVVALCYTIVRVVHGITYVVASGSDRALRRQVILTMAASTLPSSTLFFVGAVIGSPWQVWIWLIAFVADVVLVYLTSKDGDWRVNSPAHFAERYGLIVILALGESIVAIGAGVAREPVSATIIVGALLAVGMAVALWWAYFVRIARSAEHALSSATGVRRARLATDGFTYLHITLVAGIILAALGIEVAMEYVGEFEHSFAWFGAIALSGGVSLYLFGSALFHRRMTGNWLWVRIAGATVVLLSVFVTAAVASLIALGITLALVIVMLVVEWRTTVAPTI